MTILTINRELLNGLDFWKNRMLSSTTILAFTCVQGQWKHCIDYITQKLDSTTFLATCKSSPFESQLPSVLYFLSGSKTPTQSPACTPPIVHNVVHVRIIVDGLLDLQRPNTIRVLLKCFSAFFNRTLSRLWYFRLVRLFRARITSIQPMASLILLNERQPWV